MNKRFFEIDEMVFPAFYCDTTGRTPALRIKSLELREKYYKDVAHIYKVKTEGIMSYMTMHPMAEAIYDSAYEKMGKQSPEEIVQAMTMQLELVK